MRFSTIIVILLGSALIGCGFYYFGGPEFRENREAKGSDSPVPFTVLKEDVNVPTMDRRVNYRITTIEEYAELWELMYGNNSPALPAVDFATHEVIAVFDGSHAGNGYAISVERIEDVGGKRVVSIMRTEPGAGCSVSTSLNEPFALVSMKRSSLPLAHVDTFVTSPACSR